ncbi:MAG: GNAT family N-acetyltransferase [Blastocatellia bacterium]
MNRITQVRMDYCIDKMNPSDWDQVRSIYIEGLATGNATFETEAPSWEKWDANHLRDCRLVARTKDTLLGWAALSPASSRTVYAGVAELSVYVPEASRGKGVGRELLRSLIAESERIGIWTLQAGIFPENTASITLHLNNGFREIGRRERPGKLKGVWRDVVLLERRSRVAGID